MATVARLHSDDRYNRLTTDLPRLTGHPAQSVEQYIRLHRNQFGPTTDPTRQPEPLRDRSSDQLAPYRPLRGRDPTMTPRGGNPSRPRRGR
jgi:hypothetical protein